MAKILTLKTLVCILIIFVFCGTGLSFAQLPNPTKSTPATIGPATPVSSPVNAPANDTVTVQEPYNIQETNNMRLRQGIFDQDPPNLVRTIEYDPATNQYILYERVGNMLYRAPQYLTYMQYLAIKQQETQRDYFKTLADQYAYQSQQPGFIPQIKIRSQTFEQIFGGPNIDIKAQGSANATFAGQLNKNDNPLFNSQQRNQFNFNFDQQIQLNVTGMIGTNLAIATNYNTNAQFQFDNQIKMDYKGKQDDIIQEIQAGTVSMPLNTTLITGTQALFGVKTKLKFGKLNITSIISQQRSQSKTITITNGAEQGNFKLTTDAYDANKHYFLSQYFRNNYDKALANSPLISSNVNITKIEVWITNRNNSTTNSRDILAFMDLGENNPYDKRLIQGGAGYSPLPAGTDVPGFAQQSNSLLKNLPAGARLTNSNTAANYFASTGGSDNYAGLTYARQLTSKEYTLHPQLGYISLNYPLNNDEVLAVAYQYTYNGVTYQVGEFSSDRPVNNNTPNVLYVKLLKNTLLKTNLPTWNLMMKNIYSLGAYQISPTNFKMAITRLDNASGIAKPIMAEGKNTTGKLWLQLTGLDNLDQQNQKIPDGYFDYLEGITIDSHNGLLIFPEVEPFGADLAAKFAPGETSLINTYVYQPLYDSTQAVAQQFYPLLNRYVISGTYTSQGGGEYQLNATNIPQGSVVVTVGATKLVEGNDYTVDYNAGTIRILNQSILSSGQPISVNLENNELFGVQQKSLYGSRFDYQVSPKFALGATIMHLTEEPISQNEAVGDESISNTIWGFDANYNSPSRMLTRLVDKIPFIHTKVPSSVSLSGEFAQLLPGTPSSLNYAGSKNGTAYLDDFENSQSQIDLKSANTWQISSTPDFFPESQLFNNLGYGFNRARLAFYNIDPTFYTSSTIPVSRAELSKPYVREVLQTEVFPYIQSVTGEPQILPTLDLAFYPNTRGPYNYVTTGINQDGTLQSPNNRWGGMMRAISTTDFEALNVTYIEFWVLDPFIGKPNSTGGDIYFDLGNISEDILKDGRKSIENGLPVNGDLSTVDTTAWGRVAKLQPVVNTFDNDPNSRALQDVGLDGLGDADERAKFGTQVQRIQSQVNPQAAAAIAADPSTDDYQYYQGPALDQAGAGILQRYARYNGTDGNSKTAAQSEAQLGLQTSASTSLPDEEDIDRDNNMNQDDEYFEYHVNITPKNLVVGQGFVNDKVTSSVKLADGTTQTYTWYQFRIPITNYQSTVGGIQDFKSIRFLRLFMTNFADTAVLRFASLQLVRGDWRAFDSDNNPANVIADPAIVNPVPDGSSLVVGTVNINENGNRTPIPYVVPPGIQRQTNYSGINANTKLNEQSLSLTVNNLKDGYSQAAFKTFNNDLRQYKNLQMFVHAEALPTSTLNNNDLHTFIRLGLDYTDNYYEYEIPLTVTQPGTTSPAGIWPAANQVDLELSLLTNAKLARDAAKYKGQPWPLTLPYTITVGIAKITIMGQPDLSRLTTVMLGVRNPFKGNNPGNDDGLAKSGMVWFDELRLTDFNQRDGWAAIAKADIKLADFADVTVSGSDQTAGFGTLDSKIGDRSLDNNSSYNISANIELGKFFPDKSGVHIPTYINVSQQVSAPLYDPAQPDVLLSQTLKNATSSKQRDSIKNAAESLTQRQSINFTNVHVAKTDPKAPNRVYDISNFNATYAYTNYEHHDFTTLSDFEKTYRLELAYNYADKPNYWSPFSKIIKKNSLQLIKDINIDLIPTRVNMSIDFDRFDSETTLRNNDPSDIIAIPTTYNNTFTITRIFGLGWNLTKSLTLNFDATNLSTVDEPQGPLTGLNKDTLYNNLARLGRTTNYNHTFALNYAVPFSKIPYMDWITANASYSAHFNWLAEPGFSIDDPELNVGNSIQNSHTILLNPTLNFVTLYNKFKLLRKPNKPEDGPTGFKKILLSLLTAIKTVNVTYTRTEGIFLPGYLPQSTIFGEDPSYNAPGIGFLLGSQSDIRQRAVENGWISDDTLQNQAYVKTYSADLHMNATLEPIQGLRINLTAFKTQDQTYQTTLKYLDETGDFQNLSPVTTGDYSMSYLTIGTAFSKTSGVNNTSPLYNAFLNDRSVISERLGKLNPNSTGTVTNGFADGYGPNSQNVLVPAFLAAYSGKSAATSNLSQFPDIPLPNWQITYGGLVKIPFMADIFDSFDLKHAYSSTYNVGGYSTLLQYTENDGSVNARDINNDFLPMYQFSQVTIFEQFAPLLGIDMRFKNGVTTSISYMQSRALSLSLLNSQLAQQNEDDVVLSFGYKAKNFRFPFGLWEDFILKNDLTFNLAFALRNTKTLIYEPDILAAQVSSGAENITYRPEISYALTDKFNISFFYDANITKPYTSQSFNTSFTTFGFSLKLILQ